MKHYESLDSIRGIAALSVVFSHMLIAFPSFLLIVEGTQSVNPLVNLLSYTPLHLIWAGHEAVILFFILSGFVLSLSMYNGKNINYQDYVIKRFFRIYMPYIIIIFTSIFLQQLIYPTNQLIGLSEWFNSMWSNPFNLEALVHLVFMTGEYTHNYNTVAWSLVHEMRISIVFPFIVFQLVRTNWKQDLIIMLGVIIGSVAIPSNLPYLLDDTFYYLLFFIMGSILAKNRKSIGTYYKRLTNKSKLSILVVAMSLYALKWSFGFLFQQNDVIWTIVNNARITDFSTALAAVLIFVISMNSPKIESLLRLAPLRFLGKISYSLYLVHPIVLLLLMYTLVPLVNPVVILIAVPIISIYIAYLYNMWIEEPSNTLGKSLSRKNRTDKKLIRN